MLCLCHAETDHANNRDFHSYRWPFARREVPLLGEVLRREEEANWFCFLVSKPAKRKEAGAWRTGAAAERHFAPVAPTPERQWPAAAKARLGHPTHQRARELQRALSTAAGSGKLERN